MQPINSIINLTCIFHHRVFYKELIKQLTICKKSGLPLKEEIQQCFEVAYLFLKKILDSWKKYPTQDMERIVFHKTILPLFICEVHYFELLYHACLFIPTEKAEAIVFWKREARRLERFQRENQNFYWYTKSRKTDLDPIYFMEILNNNNNQCADLCTLEMGKGSFLLGYLMALERYHAYATHQIVALTMNHQ